MRSVPTQEPDPVRSGREGYPWLVRRSHGAEDLRRRQDHRPSHKACGMISRRCPSGWRKLAAVTPRCVATDTDLLVVIPPHYYTKYYTRPRSLRAVVGRSSFEAAAPLTGTAFLFGRCCDSACSCSPPRRVARKPTMRIVVDLNRSQGRPGLSVSCRPARSWRAVGR
jgi:hypothetical protein